MKYALLFTLCCVLTAMSAAAQTTYTVTANTTAGQNPGGLNTDADNTTTSWTDIHTGAVSVNSWSAAQTLPFNFYFYDVLVTQFRVSHNGLLTFDTTSALLPSVNDNLPSANLPDNTICVFWDEFTSTPPTGSGDDVDMKVFGTAPNRQLWVRWYSFEYGNPSGTYAYFAVALEETTNKVYVVDMSYYIGSHTTTVGVQLDVTEATQFGTNTLTWANTSNLANTNNGWYEFTPLTPIDRLQVSAGWISGFTGAGYTDVPAASFGLLANHNANQAVSAVTVTLGGSIAPGNVTNLKLWHDQNSNGVVDGTDPQLGSTVTALTSGNATFSGTLITVPFGTSARLLVTCDVGASATGGQVISFSIVASSAITSAPGPVVGLFPTTGGPGLTVASFNATVPFAESFDGGSLPANVMLATAPGTYPNATAVGTTPGSGGRSGTATAQIETTGVGAVSALSGAGYLRTAHATGGAAAAIDIFMDLSAFNAATDNIELSFWYIDDGMDTTATNTVFNYAFISTDGGASWLTALYNIDVTATTASWTQAVIDLSAALNTAGGNFTNRVILRIQCSDDSTADSMSFEDILVREVQTGLEVGNRNMPGAGIFPVNPIGDVVVLAPTFNAQGVNQSITSLNVYNTGSVADAQISAVKLWIDQNSNGVLDSADGQHGATATFSGGVATFNPINLAPQVGTPIDVLITYEFVAGTTGTVGCAINGTADVTAAPGPVFALFPQTFPIGFNSGSLVTYTSALPYQETFDATIAGNVALATAPGSYPTATAVGSTTSTSNAANEAVISLEGTFQGTAPNSGASHVAMHFDNGQATAALDFYFDLSAFNATSDQVEFRFALNDDGLDNSATLNDPFDYVFISTDGGATWLTALYFIDATAETSTTANVYRTASVDVSALLRAVSGNFTNQVVIRIQAADNLATDLLFIDDVELEFIPPTAPVVDTPMATGGNAAVMITEVAADPGASGNEFIEITNVSAAPVDMTGWTIYVWEAGVTSAPATSVVLGSFTLAGGALMLAADVSTDGNYTVDVYIGANILDWNDCGVVITDATGVIVDAAFFGTIDPTLIANPFPIGSAWNGPTAAAPPVNGPAQERNGTSDHNDASDWAASIAPPNNDSISVLNTGLSLPWTTGVPTIVFGGAAPAFTATIELGGDLNFEIEATDVNTIGTLTWSIIELGTGSLTAAQAGFDQTFTAGVYADPNPGQPSPHKIELTGIAGALGTVDFQLEVSDGTFTTTVTLSITIQTGTPLIRTRNLGTLEFFTYGTGTPSAFEDTFEVSGYSLTTDLVVTAPADFEVSQTTGSGFGASVALTPGTGGVVQPTTIFVRYSPVTAGPHAEDITLSSTGASDVLVAVSGEIIAPTAPVLADPRAPFTGSPVIITEIDVGNDAIEIQNVSGGTFDATGWQLILSDDYTSINDANVITKALGQFAVDEIQFWEDTPTSSPNYWGNNILWNPGAFPTFTGWAMLVDSIGVVRDFVALNWPAANVQGMSVNAGGFTGLNPAAVWSGNGLDLALNGAYERNGNNDNNDATDFVAPVATSFGTTNPAMNLPFTGVGLGFIQLSGAAPNFSGLAFIGDDLELNFDATDINILETLTFTITVTGGTLPPAQIGFNQTFVANVYNDPAPAQGPHSILLDGTALTAGDIQLLVEVSDGMMVTSYTLDLSVQNYPSAMATNLPSQPFFAPAPGVASPEQSYTIEGFELLSDMTINAPTPFEISLTTGTGFASQLILSPVNGSLSPTTIFVRYNPAGSGPNAGDITHAFLLGSTVRVPVAGFVGNTPALIVTGTPLAQFVTPYSTPSAEQTFNVAGNGVVGNVNVTAPVGFEVSRTAGTGFGPSVTLPIIGSSFPLTTVFVRFNPAAGSPTNQSGDIQIDTLGPASAVVAVQGMIGNPNGGGGGGGGGSDSGGGGCASGSSSLPWLALLIAGLLVVPAIRKRRA